MVSTEERLVDIELKLVAAEDLLQSLNEQVYQQQKQIDELRTLCTVLVKRLEAATERGSQDAYAHEKPPHY